MTAPTTPLVERVARLMSDSLYMGGTDAWGTLSIQGREVFVACARAIIPLVAAAQKEAEWQPIETAPKDRSPLLHVWVPFRDINHGRLNIVRWDDEENDWREDQGELLGKYIPTHWRYPPEPPAAILASKEIS